MLQSKLKMYLAAIGKSAYWLQKETGLSYNTIYRLMRHDGVGNLYTWTLIAGALGCTIDEIINYEATEVYYGSE